MAMTMKPAPCEAPVNFCEGALKFLMSCWNGAYMIATRIWPPMPMAIPTTSMTRKRTPRSRKKCRVPCVRLASQGAPMKPIHSPIRVVTTYHSGGTEAEAMAVICAADFPAMAPATSPKINAKIWPTRKPMTA